MPKTSKSRCFLKSIIAALNHKAELRRNLHLQLAASLYFLALCVTAQNVMSKFIEMCDLTHATSPDIHVKLSLTSALSLEAHEEYNAANLSFLSCREKRAFDCGPFFVVKCWQKPLHSVIVKASCSVRGCSQYFLWRMVALLV